MSEAEAKLKDVLEAKEIASLNDVPNHKIWFGSVPPLGADERNFVVPDTPVEWHLSPQSESTEKSYRRLNMKPRYR